MWTNMRKRTILLKRDNNKIRWTEITEVGDWYFTYIYKDQSLRERKKVENVSTTWCAREDINSLKLSAISWDSFVKYWAYLKCV